MDVALVSLLLTWNRFRTLFWYFYYYFEQINARWAASCNSVSQQIIEGIRKAFPTSISSSLEFINKCITKAYSALNLYLKENYISSFFKKATLILFKNIWNTCGNVIFRPRFYFHMQRCIQKQVQNLRWSF